MLLPVTEGLLEEVQEIINANPDYNILHNGKPSRALEDIREEFLADGTESYLVLIENRYIGAINFFKNNPNDNLPGLVTEIITVGATGQRHTLYLKRN